MRKITGIIAFILIVLCLGMSCTDEKIEYTISVEYNSNLGAVSPDGEVKVVEGGSKLFEFEPIEGASVDHLIIDNLVVEGVDSIYTITNVTEDINLKVVFKASNASLLTGGDWHLKGWVYEFSFDNADYVIDLYENPDAFADFDVCLLDDIMSFNSDGSYINKPGENVCDGNFGILGNGEWEFSDNEDRLVLAPYGQDFVLDHELVSLSDDELVISMIEYIGISQSFKSLNLQPSENVPATVIMTFRH